MEQYSAIKKVLLFTQFVRLSHTFCWVTENRLKGYCMVPFWKRQKLLQRLQINQWLPSASSGGRVDFTRRTWGNIFVSQVIKFSNIMIIQFSSVQSLSCVRLFLTPWITACQASLYITNSRVHSDSRSLNQWCHPAFSSSAVPFASCSQSLPASGSFPISQLFTWGGQSTGVSASTSLIPMNTQDWSPLQWTSWISLGLSRVFSSTTVQKHQFFHAQLSL